MPDIITAIIASAPNLAVAIWCIRQYQQTIEKLLDNQEALINRFIEQLPMHPNNEVKGKID